MNVNDYDTIEEFNKASAVQFKEEIKNIKWDNEPGKGVLSDDSINSIAIAITDDMVDYSDIDSILTPEEVKNIKEIDSQS